MTIQHSITADGSSTLYSSKYKERYHSSFGAVGESQHIFIEQGLNLFPFKKEISIFEMGFGTGLNVLLTALNGEQKIRYVSLEAEPLEAGIYEQLNYPSLISHPDASKIYQLLIKAPWNKNVQITSTFELLKAHQRLQEFKTSEKFDLIYYDAFSPGVQPELWTKEVFYKIYQMCHPQAMLVTYSSRESVRQAMEATGFKVECLPGPPGKRHMVRAIAS